VTAALSPAERAVAESLLSAAWGEPVVVCAADVVWDRAHVVRLRTRDGRSAILKRVRSDPEVGASGSESFGIELASWEYLAGMPVPVAPRLLGADVTAGVLVMEELPPGRSLADSLLLGDRVTAVADLAAYVTALGVAVRGADAEIDELVATLEATRYRSFVHGDLCPDGELTAALAGWVVGRGAMLGQALHQDDPWGTTTMRPRLLFWTQRFAATAAATGAFPRLRILAEALDDRLASRWPRVIVPAYPALAGADSALAERPPWWAPGR
jgi:hypothetical protein